jgi:very-short-patch-repair endonuclease
MENKKVCSVKRLCSDTSCITCNTRSFANHEKSKYWSDENGEIKPRNVFKGSGKKYLFDCDVCNHTFNAQLCNITKLTGTWCPYCCIPSKKMCYEYNCSHCFKKSFASHPKSIYWSDKNELTARQVFKCSNNKYIFKCDTCNHEIELPLNAINAGIWCLYCCHPPQKLCENNDCSHCFEKSFDSHPKALYWSDKNKLTARQVFKSSDTKKYILFCDICNHEFERLPYNIQDDITHCIYCAVPTKLICENNNCEFCYKRSFASCDHSKYWSEKNILTPRQVIRESNVKYIFYCGICNHEYNSCLSNISKGQGCPYCCISSNILCDNNECNHCLNRSFACHEKSKYWSSNNKTTPRQVIKMGDSRIEFNCICGHSFNSQIKNISQGGWCPYCSIPTKKICYTDNCFHCFEKSFASHYNAVFWSDENKLTPREIIKGCNKKFHFVCKNNHKFTKALIAITGGRNGWCPQCVNKTETKLFEQLSLSYPSLLRQYKVDWCKNITHLPFDFCIEEYKIIIELDGAQHFIQVSNWKSPEDTQERDTYKMGCAKENGYSIIRIIQEDVWGDKYEWLEELKENIEKIKNECIVQNIFMCKNNEYREIILECKDKYVHLPLEE